MALFDVDQFTTPAHREATAHMRVAVEGSIREIIDPLFLTRSADGGLTAHEFSSWRTRELETASFLEELEAHTQVEASVHYRQSEKVEALVRVGEALLTITYHSTGHVWIGSAAVTQREAAGAIGFIGTVFPEQKPSNDSPAIGFGIWTESSHTPMRHTMDVTPWSELASNYPTTTRDHLAALASPDFEAGRDGKLVLLFGPPGTGKSTFITSLAYEWRKFGELQVVADPGAVLADPEYLTRVALSRRQEKKWGVVLLEDSGGLFAPDAEQRSGEGRLGALLNLGSGIIGTASRTLWVLTTNLPLSDFHSAVARPGRCAAAIEMTAFPAEEAREWLVAKERPDLAADVRGELTLAELYALLNGKTIESDARQPVGFRAAVKEAS